MTTINVAMLGTGFMGRAHSNAWSQVRKFFSPEIAPRLSVACGRDHERTHAFAANWGWHESACDWREVIKREDIGIIDIALPSHLHHQVAIAAARAGKHVFCEKPMASSLMHARAMHEEAQKAGIVHFVNHNYRRAPAVMLAKALIADGRIGRIFHWRGAYQQDWLVDPDFPLTWHLHKDQAGSGAHADLNSHSIDLAHYLVGRIRHTSCLTTTFVNRRPLPGTGAATFSAGSPRMQSGEVTVDDAALMMVEFASGALGSFEATRFASGRKNRNQFEIYGSAGSLAFDLERMNELSFYDHRDAPGTGGFRTILATDPCHPYVKHWWPPGHLIGYEHTFVHAISDFLAAIAGGPKAAPDFADGLEVMAVLDAGLRSASMGQRVAVHDHQTTTSGCVT